MPSNIYLLVKMKKPGAERSDFEVQVFNKTADLLHTFSVERGDWDGTPTAGNNKVLGPVVQSPIKLTLG